MNWLLPDRTLDLTISPLVMGIVNVTPDSFSDGGTWLDPKEAVRHALQLVEEGAAILDIGGESSRPGAEPVSLEEEWRRVGPVVRALKKVTHLPLSIDTVKPEIARRAFSEGALIVNDITGLENPDMRVLVRDTRAGAVVMHMQGRPRTMQHQPTYVDVVKDIRDWLDVRMKEVENSGINREALVIDPGIGFGKSPDHNLALLARLDEFAGLERPVLVGPSRKAFIGKILDLPVTDRLEGTAAAVAVAVWNGARLVRVHDVGAMVRVVKIVESIQSHRTSKV